ncbi:MAG: S8 family serine peptidase [Acidobacteriia bacterium]|nr:S8 family serine peptidase [Terriglobia bacterium]
MPENPTEYQAIDNSDRPHATGAKRVRATSPKETISVSIRVRPRTDGPAMPDQNLLAATPPGARKHMTREEFASAHGASPTDLDQIAAFARAHGLTIVESSIPRRTVVLSGTAEQMNRAFAVELGNYETATEKYRGHEGSVQVPTNIANLVEGVFGLDNRPMVHPHVKQAVSPHGTTPLTPPQVAKLYDFPTSPTAAGQTIGILEFGGGFKTADIQNYFNNVVHLPVPAVVAVGVDGATNSPGGSADTEVILDIDVAGSVAPGAKLVVYFAPNTVQGIVDCITTAVHDAVNRPSVLSISWGGNESGWGSSINTITKAIAEAALLGVTILVSSGDSGSEKPAQVEYFASDPGVTACGGTTIQNVAGTAFTQTTWAGSGGGISNVFGLPYWQTWAGVPHSVNPVGHIGRGVPDIAGNADPNSGYMLILNGASTGPWGGTSAVAPLYAGLVALLNASLGEPVGYLNYNLYAFAGPFVYKDITTGNNGLYNAGPGYDCCTGFGTVDGAAMLTALRGVGLPVALALFNGKLHMAWKGMEFDDRIFWSTFSGATWAPQQMVPGVATSSGVALAVYNGKLYMAWKGMNADQGIWFSSFNGTTWTPQQPVPGVGTSTGPRLAVFNNLLYMAWKGLEGDQRIFWSTFNGAGWTPQAVVPNVATSVGPALAVFGNSLYMAWKGMFGDQALYWSKLNGTAWAPQQLIPGVASSEGPSLCAFQNALYAIWKGMLGDQTLWYSHFNGTSWAPQKQIAGVASSVGPSLADFNSVMYAAWKGMLGDQAIWFSSFNGTTWAAQKKVPGVGTSPDYIVAKTT